MTEELDKIFVPTHILNGIPVMRIFPWKFGTDPWIDENGNTYKGTTKNKAAPIELGILHPMAQQSRDEKFGVTYGRIGEEISSEWWLSHYSHSHAEKGVMVTREAASAALRACAWPDSSAPCGQAGNSNDDDAVFVGRDEGGNCIVRLFMRGKGYFRVKIPASMFLEIVDE
jgi:hypothetical protein